MPKISLDAIDRRILRSSSGKRPCFQCRTRQRSVGVSASPCWRRVRELERTGVISRYVTLVDPAAVGLPVSVFIQVSLEKQVESALEVFKNAILERPEVMECYLMTGDADYMLRVVVADLEAYERFLMDHLTRVPAVANIPIQLCP